MVGHFLDEGVRNVGDGNAARGRGLDVDAVDADAAERDHPALLEAVDDLLGDRDALGVDRIGIFCGCDEARFIGRRFDDLGADRRELLELIAIATAGYREARTFWRHYLELRHTALPLFLLNLGLAIPPPAPGIIRAGRHSMPRRPRAR